MPTMKAKRAVPIPTYLATVPASRISSACSCFITAADPEATVTSVVPLTSTTVVEVCTYKSLMLVGMANAPVERRHHNHSRHRGHEHHHHRDRDCRPVRTISHQGMVGPLKADSVLKYTAFEASGRSGKSGHDLGVFSDPRWDSGPAT